ncbi:MAG: hypothetical protein ABEJ84_03845 [Halodesulfurarchaeum sp.]
MALLQHSGRGRSPQTVRTVALVVLIVVGGTLGSAVFPLLTAWPGGGMEVVDVGVADGTDSILVTVSRPVGGDRTLRIEGGDGAVVDPDADIAFVPSEQLPAELEPLVGNHRAGVGRVGPWAVVGRLSVASVNIGGNDVSVVAPANGSVDPARKAYFLRQFVGPYRLDAGPSERITIYAGPSDLPGVGRMYPDDTGYVTQRGFWDGEAASVWIHEYVHARQNFQLAEEMRWFEEASAVYLSMRMLEEQYGPVTERDVRRRLASLPDGEPVALANPAAWRRSHTDYRRGARLVARIDDRIRSKTGGTHTVLAVIRRLNAADGPVGIEQFVSTLEAITGAEEDWVRDRITEPPASVSGTSSPAEPSLAPGADARSGLSGGARGRYRNR